MQKIASALNLKMGSVRLLMMAALTLVAVVGTLVFTPSSVSSEVLRGTPFSFVLACLTSAALVENLNHDQQKLPLHQFRFAREPFF